MVQVIQTCSSFVMLMSHITIKINPPPPPPAFRGPGFPESARNVSPNQWISDSGGKKDHLLKVFVLW